MKRSTMKLAGLCVGLSLAAASVACGGGMAEGNAETAASAGGGSASVSVKLGLPKVDNPKYDKFFDDVTQLAQLVADARATLETASATLNKATNVTDTTDFDTALKNVSGKLKGKVTVTVNVGPTGADVSVVPVAGVTLSADDQTMIDAYKKVITDVGAIPGKLEPIVAKSIDLSKQAAVLVVSAKSDFTGMSGMMKLPSVISGMQKVTTAMDGIKTDVPVIVDKSKTMIISIKGAV